MITGNGYDGEMQELHCGTFGSTQIESKQYTKFYSWMSENIGEKYQLLIVLFQDIL